MLDYIYQGEVSIHQEYLDRFIEIATKFQLHGLLMDNKGEDFQETHFGKIENDQINHDILPEGINENEKYVKQISLKPMNQIFEANNAEIDEKFAELIEKEDNGPYRCTVCERKTKDKRDMKRHLETHLSGLSYTCSQCSKSFRSSNSLRMHDIRNHS